MEQALSTFGHGQHGRGASGRRQRPGVAALACLLALFAGAAAAEEGDDGARDQVAEHLAQLGERIRSEEAILDEVRREAASVLESLESAEARLRQLDADVARARAEEGAATERLLRAHADLTATRDAYLAQIDLLAPRLRAMQKLSGRRGDSLLFSARSFSQFLRRRKALERVLEGDLRWLSLAKAARDALEARARQLDVEQAIHREKVRETLSREAVSRQQRDELSSLHRRLREERGLREKALAELAAAEDKLRAHLSAIGAEAPAEGDAGLPDLFALGHKGKLAFPAEGFIEVGFGRIVNPKFNTVTFQNGLDIRARQGSPVRAVAPGKVVHAAPFRGYGNLVILDHGDGYHSLYAHLDEIACAPGLAIAEGAAIGAVGQTGSLKGAYLYFELRQRGKPIDPKDWFGGP